MRVFITGGSGFVGGHVIERLARSKEHELLAMARSERSAKTVTGYGARAVRCDLDAIEASHLAGCDAVIHSAAYVEEWGTREQFWRGNVEGTTRMLEVARKAGVRRFVHIGTEAVLFDGHDLVDVDERHPYPAKQRYLYSETKAEAERRVLSAASSDFVALSVRPRLVWGPRDTTILPGIVRAANAGQFAWLDGGRSLTSTAHVTNVAHGIALALERGKAGEAYFIADDGTRTIREFLTVLLATQGIVLPERNLPGAVARPIARAIEGAWHVFGVKRQPPMTAMAVAMMSRTVTVNTRKAKAALGYAPVIDVQGGLAELARGK